MNLKNIHSVYFIGIGGIGMSAIARYFCSVGISVFGYDRVSSFITNELVKLGADIHFDDRSDLIDSSIKSSVEGVLVVYTPAIPEAHEEFNFFKNNNYRIIKRAEALGLITKDIPSIGVAGTHGKTTTSSMVAHIMNSIDLKMTAFLGGISTNYNSNLVLSDNTEFFVVEADEYDRSFLQLNPETSIITSVDADHLDIYGEHDYLKNSFNQYVSQTVKNIVVHDSIKDELDLSGKNVLTYSETGEGDSYAKDIRVVNGVYVFDYVSNYFDVEIRDVKLRLPGKHNVSNMVAAITSVLFYDDNIEEIKEAVESYAGVKRRFEYHIDGNDLKYIDDYAHHPKEIQVFLNSVNELYPDKKVTAIFQPHLFSRTRDFAKEFSESLSKVDELILLDIYPAREFPIEGVTSELLLNDVNISDKKIMSKEELLAYSEVCDVEIFVTIGAGDIDRLIPQLKINLLDNKRDYKVVKNKEGLI